MSSTGFRIFRILAFLVLASGFSPPLWAGSFGLRFDGTNDYVTFGPAPGLGAGTFTLETWFKRTGPGVGTATGSGGLTDGIPLVTKGRAEADGDTRDMNYFLGIRASDSKLAADFEEGAGGTSPGLNHPVAGVTTISNQVWYHAAVSYDGARWRLYLNGVLETELVVSQPPRSDSIQHAALGSALDSSGVAAGFFQGELDEVRIWNYVRSSQEIADNQKRQIVSAAGLIGRWSLDQSLGTTATNTGSSGVDGTLVNGPFWVADYPFGSAPSISITNPPDLTAFTIPGTVLIAATASDPDGSVTNVVFLADGVKIGEATASPFTFNWTPVAVGNFTLLAVAADDSGLSTTSAPVRITINDAVVRIAAPTNHAFWTVPIDVPITVDVGTNSNVALLEFFAGTNKLGQSSMAPYGFTWSNAPPGAYSLAAIATLSDNTTHTSAPVNITISAGNQAPSVTLTSPINGASFASATDLSFSATAADTDGTIAKVEFYINGQKFGADSNAPYSVVWSNAAVGSYTLTAIATDNRGATGLSAPVAITVTNRATGTNTLISQGFFWKYLDNGSDQGTPWREPAFDDSSWQTGLAQLGYGDGDEATVISYGPDPNNRFITTYFRRAWNVADPAIYQALILRLIRDDGAVVYLNGREVIRSNMPAGPISSTTLASVAVGGTDESTYFSTAIDPTNLVAGINVVAVEVHQASSNSTDVSFDMQLLAIATSGANLPTLLRGPYLQTGTTNGVIVRWRTDVACASTVRFGTNGTNLNLQMTDLTPTTEHIAPLSGLAADTQYFYSIGAGATVLGSGPDFYFLTSPPVGIPRPTRLWVIGDSGDANNDARNVRDSYLRYSGTRPADIWLMLGDNAYNNGTDAQYQPAVFDMYPTILRNRVLWPTIGNHDTDQQTVIANFPYLDIFSLPQNGEAGGLASGTERYYSFDYANVHFVCLDAMTSSRATNGAMAQWLRSDLGSTTQPWVIAFWHHPPYTKGNHDSDVEVELVEMRQNIVPILEAGGVDLVLSGHSHVYERSYFLHGHYGYSSTLNDGMKVDAGDGRDEGSSAYQKPGGVGAVYTVCGCSGHTSFGPLNHPAMFVSVQILGSLVIDVLSNRLDLAFITTNATVLDHFTILKGTNAAAPPTAPANLAATLIAPDTIRLTWDNSPTNELGFVLERSTDGTNFSTLTTLGANFTRYTNSSLNPSATYSYRVRATNSAGASDYSNVAVTPGPPAIVQGPVGTNVFLGGQAVFSVTASGTAPLAYQWRFKGAALLNQTNSTLILSNVQPSDGGFYAVRVTNLFGNVISSSALLNVTTNRPPVASGYATARFPSQGVKFRASLLGGVDPDGDTLVLTAITPNSPNGASISRVGDWVIYSPPDGFTNADSFLYLLRDGRGGSATGAVAVAVMNNLQTAENVVTENVGGDSIHLRFSGVPGRAYTIQFCDDADHLNWQPLATRTAETDGHFEYTDTPPAASPARLYRSSYP